MLGEQQTVGRAELSTLIAATRATTGNGTVHIDNAEVVDGFWAGRYARQTDGPNADLRHGLAEAIGARQGFLIPVKVKGVHLSDRVGHIALADRKLPSCHFFGNLYAHRFACKLKVMGWE